MSKMDLVPWAGKKTPLLPQLLPFFPLSITGKYLEPFAGSAVVFLNRAITSIYTGIPVLGHGSEISDINRRLMNWLFVVKHSPEEFIAKTIELERILKGKSDDDREALFYQLREEMNSIDTTWGDVDQAVRFLFLIKMCHCGLYRVNKDGEFNVSWGYRKNLELIIPENIRECSRALALTELFCCDFEERLKAAVAGDFVYLDPPYDNSFTAYTSGGFFRTDQKRLADACKSLNARGVQFMLSNSDTVFIRDLYKDFNIHEVTVARKIGRKHGAANTAREVIVTNYNTHLFRPAACTVLPEPGLSLVNAAEYPRQPGVEQ